jgi:nucleoside-diphosphate-sugar epimerase
MRVFVTGASGWIGSAVVPELLGAGHQVLGLARSDASAAALTAAGAEVLRGSLDEPESLRAGAESCDAVIHLAFVHDFGNFAEAIAKDRATVELFGDVLAGTDKPLAIASGVAGLSVDGRPLTEGDPGPADSPNGRLQTAVFTQGLAERGVRSIVVRLGISVHGDGDPGFVSVLVDVARRTGVAGYIGDGANRWPAVARTDAARLFRLAIEGAPAGSVVHGVAEDGVPTRDIARAIGDGLGLPVQSVAPEQAAEHFGWIGMFFGVDAPATHARTTELLGWEPTGAGLLEDVRAHYLG